MKITTNDSTEFNAAMAEVQRNGWRVTAMSRGKHNAQWVLEVDDTPQPARQQDLPIGKTRVCTLNFERGTRSIWDGSGSAYVSKQFE